MAGKKRANGRSGDSETTTTTKENGETKAAAGVPSADDSPGGGLGTTGMGSMEPSIRRRVVPPPGVFPPEGLDAHELPDLDNLDGDGDEDSDESSDEDSVNPPGAFGTGGWDPSSMAGSIGRTVDRSVREGLRGAQGPSGPPGTVRIPEPRAPRAEARPYTPPLTGYEHPDDLPDLDEDEDEDEPSYRGPTGFSPQYGQPPPRMPVWSRIKDFPTTHRLKVKRVELDGRESDLGPVHADITEEELIMRWPRPQTLLLYPIDQVGKNLAPNNPERLDIAEDHSILQELKKRGARGMGMGDSGMVPYSESSGSASKDVLALVTMMMENQKIENAKIREEVRLREERIERERATLEREKAALRENETSLAIVNADSLRGSTDKLLEGFEQRNNGLLALLANNSKDERDRRREEERSDRERRDEERKREREEREAAHKQAMEAERQRFEQTGERDRLWLERQRDADKRDNERERNALEREEKRIERWQKEQHAAMLERDKMRHEHMETLLATTGSGGLDKAIETIEKLREAQDVLGGGKDDGEEKKGGVAGALEAVGGLIRAYKGEPTVVMPPGGFPMQGGGYGGGYDDDGGGPYGPPQLPGPPPPGTLAMPPGYGVAIIQDPNTGQPVQVLVPMNQAAAQGAPPQQQPQGQQQGQQQGGAPGQHPAGQVINMPGGPQLSTNQLAQASGMTLPDVKLARDVIRATVKQLKTLGQEQWQDVIVAALAGSPQAVSYLRAVSVMVAVKEGGADDILMSDICIAVAPIAQAQGIPVRP